ncbi:hypothetical protein [Mucilaginibacter agri]|uniref:Uncharacterized protein n=1 Tax=Mucilaginibacter agri TaxID=2695265 RepID=A0A965ZF61_9SPHI|nr:hypothetical protein [Mucilaginibacter agri]NCD69780.1 hypothetical protein [Mucilaginibacter agri]
MKTYFETETEVAENDVFFAQFPDEDEDQESDVDQTVVDDDDDFLFDDEDGEVDGPVNDTDEEE